MGADKYGNCARVHDEQLFVGPMFVGPIKPIETYTRFPHHGGTEGGALPNDRLGRYG